MIIDLQCEVQLQYNSSTTIFLIPCRVGRIGPLAKGSEKWKYRQYSTVEKCPTSKATSTVTYVCTAVAIDYMVL